MGVLHLPYVEVGLSLSEDALPQLVQALNPETTAIIQMTWMTLVERTHCTEVY